MTLLTGREHVDNVIAAFFDACSSLGCTARRAAVPASSGFDPSVRFIGSHISVLLPLMLEAAIPPGGISMWQDCIRTRSLEQMYQAGRLDTAWGSYFVSMGALLGAGCASEACAILRTCLEEALGVESTLVEASCFEGDRDLRDLVVENFRGCSIRLDSEEGPYRHKVGVPTVKGRNLNVALSCNGRLFEPVANVILYEERGRPCGVEVALGTSTVVKVAQNLGHVVDAFPFPQLPAEVDGAVERCWKDAAATSLHLMREGLPTRGQHNRHRLLRRYLRVFRKSEVTRTLGDLLVRDILVEYIDQQYRTPFALPAARGFGPEQSACELLGRSP